MKAVSLNYRDLLMINGMYGRGAANTSDVITPFSDGCGVVEAVGAGVTRFKAGRPGGDPVLPELDLGRAEPGEADVGAGLPDPGGGSRAADLQPGGPVEGSGLPDRPAGGDAAVRGADRLARAVRGRAAGARRHGGAAGHRGRLDLRPAVRPRGGLPDGDHLVVRREAGAGQGARGDHRSTTGRRRTGRARCARRRGGAARTSSWRSAAAAPSRRA